MNGRRPPLPGSGGAALDELRHRTGARADQIRFNWAVIVAALGVLILGAGYGVALAALWLWVAVS